MRRESGVASPEHTQEVHQAKLKRTIKSKAPSPPRKERTSWVSAELSRVDLIWAAALALGAGALFAMTLTAHPGLGDAPESVAGIASVGVLHAPGYPSYVLAAKLFTLIEPFGPLALRVNLFSLVCAALTCGAAFLLGRRIGASRPGSAIAAIALATGGAFWFYANFAKHDAFSGLLMILAMYLLVDFSGRPTTARLCALAAVMGLEAGSSWSLGATLVPAILFALFHTRGRWRLTGLIAALGVGVAVIAALYGFVMLRAAADPTVNWGAATNLQRLIWLVTMRDFIGTAPQPGAAPTTSASASGARLAGVMQALLSQFGLVASLLAGWGAWIAARRRPGWAGPMAVALIFNLLAASLVIRVELLSPLGAQIVAEGPLFASLFVGVAFIALGATDLLERVGSTSFRTQFGLNPQRGSAALAAALTVAIIAPALALNRDTPAVEQQPLADRFATTMLNELPLKSVLIVWDAEASNPIIYRQLVLGERQDVAVIVGTGMPTAWYREQISHRLGLTIQPAGLPLPSIAHSLVNMAKELRQRGRPVYFEIPAARALGRYIGYRPVGLIAAFVDGTKHGSVGVSQGFRSEVADALRSGGLPGPEWSTFPNTTVRKTYTGALLEVAFDESQLGEYAAAQETLNLLLEIDPGNNEANADLRSLSSIPFK